MNRYAYIPAHANLSHSPELMVWNPLYYPSVLRQASTLPSIEEELATWNLGFYHGKFVRQMIFEALMDDQECDEGVNLAKEGLDVNSGLLVFGKELGKGGFGTVFEAHCTTSGRRFAAKFARRVSG